ncbi:MULTISPECIES: adenylyl-sulfate reductase [Filomicrobium]|uniref:Adenylyl-sulfate reductase n=1 Tax=Filomicrobium insigne TaxID=418854 RepID=A0A1H0QHC3_9HYPH|nr:MULTISPECIES: adenylyl-sulfate reductase [Filomicrobium]MCV0369650.1 hypothetical protein [Filomicrobium sp.]SDP16126.1 hypothetical protein SAMN04488061_2359 [Filomicrobium insigne]
MFTTNPFADLSTSISPSIIQTYVVLMALLVVAGTLFDIIHKKSAKYFFDNLRASRTKARKQLDGGDMLSIAAKTAVVDVLTSGEFCNSKRRIAHLLTMYGFIIYVITTAIMVFAYPTNATPTPAILPVLWSLGALMVCIGGYWFWFFIRADVSAEGQSPFRLMKADLFVVSLVASTTFALLWAFMQASGNAVWTTVFLVLYIIASTVLFGSVPWSKLAHMFFKPAAAFEKRMSKANGTAQNLPTITRDDPKQQQRHSMELLRDAPMNMGLGIKREAPRHY